MRGSEDLARGRIVQQRSVKAVCLLVFIVVVSLIGATPVCAQSMEGMGRGHSCAGQENAPVPSCLLTPECPLSHSAAASVLPSPSRLTLSKVIPLVRLPENLTLTFFEAKGCLDQDTPQEFSAPPCARYRCRSSLRSEEPPQT